MQAAAQELPRTRSGKVFGQEAAHYEYEKITKTKTTRKSSRDIRKSKKGWQAEDASISIEKCFFWLYRLEQSS